MESRDIRDVLLKNLSPIFDAESLSIIDVALRDILQDVELKPKETSLVLYEDCSKDILEYNESDYDYFKNREYKKVDKGTNLAPSITPVSIYSSISLISIIVFLLLLIIFELIFIF